MNFAFYTYLAQDYAALNARIPAFLGNASHAPAKTQLLASNLRLVLQRHLPESLSVGYGLIRAVGGKTFSADVIIYRKDAVLFHREGHFVILNEADALHRLIIATDHSPASENTDTSQVLIFGNESRLTAIIRANEKTSVSEEKEWLASIFESLFENKNAPAPGDHPLENYPDLSAEVAVVTEEINQPVEEITAEELTEDEPVVTEEVPVTAMVEEKNEQQAEAVAEEIHSSEKETTASDLTELPEVGKSPLQEEITVAEEKDHEQDGLVIPVKRPHRQMPSGRRNHSNPNGRHIQAKTNRTIGEDHGNTPLHEAVLADDMEKVEELLSRGEYHIEMKNRMGLTPLHLAVRENYEEMTEFLLASGADANSRSYVYDSPLHLATIENHVRIAEILIENGAEVEVRNNRAHTPLHKAAIHGSTETAEVLIRNYADLHARMEKDMQPLHLAAWYGQGEAARLLIEYGADMNAVNADGNTALHFAAFNGQVKVIKILINHDADPGITNKSGETYLQSINEGYRGEMIKVLE
ncbi:MAG: ankyrin repeat domain-containing protein [Bacteroidia bacterium]